MRIDYYTAGGGFLITKHGVTHCANDNGHP